MTLSLVHPICRPPNLPKQIAHALDHQCDDFQAEKVRMEKVLEILDGLASHLTAEDDLIVSRAHVKLQPILKKKALCLLRELLWLQNLTDKNYAVEYVLGKNMMGQGQKAPSMPTRITEASRLVESLYENREENNARMLQQIKASDDPSLDAASWSKTLADLAMPALEGPFYSLS